MTPGQETHRAPQRCPVCRSELMLTRLSCDACGSELSGRFRSCPYCSLDDADAALLELFLTSRGNMKEVERRLGVTYAAARALVDALATRLHPAEAAAPVTAPAGDGPGASEPSSVGVLDALARGDIGVDEALTALEDPRE